MTKLVSLYGKCGQPRKLGAPQYQFSLFSMSGAPVDPTKLDPNLIKDPILTVNPLELSNVDAGIQALYAIAYTYPGITFGEILKKSENKLGNIFGDFGNWVSKSIGDAGDKIGEWSGGAVRLLTDREVRSGLQDYAAAYATGGQSSAIQGLLGGEGDNSTVNQVMKFLGSLGSNSKAQVQQAGFGGMDFGNIDPKLLAIGAGGLILLVLLLKK